MHTPARHTGRSRSASGTYCSGPFVEPETKLSLAHFMKGVFIASIGLALYGVYCLVMSPIVRQEAEDLPRLTCDQLSKNRPGNHRYVALTDACLSGGRSVAQRDPDTGALESSAVRGPPQTRAAAGRACPGPVHHGRNGTTAHPRRPQRAAAARPGRA